MDKLKTSTVLKCSGCGGEIPMFEECWKDGLNYYHDRCKPVRTMENKQEFRIAEIKDPDETPGGEIKEN